MLNFAICDDESAMRQTLAGYISRFGAEHHVPISCTAFADGEALLTHYSHNFEIVLLDIGMQTLDGLESARRLRAIAPDVCLIFVTSMPQYALTGYEVHAFGYLIKPLSYEAFAAQINAACRYLPLQKGHSLLVRSLDDNFQRKINTNDILYLEVQDHRVQLHCSAECIPCRSSLAALEQELAPHGFFRCHAAYLVNQRYVARLEVSRLLLTNGTAIPISKMRRSKFVAALADYVGDKL